MNGKELNYQILGMITYFFIFYFILLQLSHISICDDSSALSSELHVY